jgi:predicted neuraminidase
VETPGGLVAACFGGLHEGHADVGVWLTRGFEGSWTPPREVANGLQGDGTRLPCWNPVLFRLTAGPLLLFYKCGPRPGTWWGLVRRSYDHGATWDAACRLPEGFLGPIKNKPVESPDGELLCPSSSEHAGWRVHFERTSDGGKTWEHSGPINDGFRFAAIQPSILRHGDGRLQVICRSKCKKVVQSCSADRGMT